MKKILSVFLVLAMTAALLSGCGGKEDETAPATVEGTVEELLNRIVEDQSVEFSGGVVSLDLADTSQEGQWLLKGFTGLDSADRITEAAAYEPMITSIAFSMVLVRVAPGESGRAVAEDMKSGVNPRKWVCVEADDLLAAGYGDLVLLVMVNTANNLTAQSFVDAFQRVVGGELEFVI